MQENSISYDMKIAFHFLRHTLVYFIRMTIFAEQALKNIMLMYKYKLTKKGNPQDKNAPKKWYATSIGEKAQSTKAMTRAATENTTTAPIEMEAALELLGKYAAQQLQQGHLVKVGDLGTLRVTFKSDGVEDITQFNASAMIKSPRIVFTPSKEFREQVLSGLQFQNGGVLEEGISYASLADYKKAKGIASGGSTEGGNGGGDNDNPLG